MARTTTVIASIISGGKTAENVTVSTTSWSTDNGTITLSASVPGTVKVGDTITDSAANSYLITAIAGSVLTCQDFDSTTDPATGAATIQEAYQTISDWEGDHDDTVLYTSGDAAIGEGYGDAAFDEDLTIENAGTASLGSITLRAASGEEPDGVIGVGFRLAVTTTERYLDILESCTIEDLEIDYNGLYPAASTPDQVIFSNPSGSGTTNYRRFLLHNMDVTAGSGDRKIFRLQGSNTQNILNCCIYGKSSSTHSGEVMGIDSFVTNGVVVNISNCTIRMVANDSGDATGVNFLDRTSKVVKNTASFAEGTTSGSKTAFVFPASGTFDYNASSDATATGTNSLTNLTASDEFVSVAEGSEDFTLKSASNIIDEAEDLATTPTGVQFDITNYDRDTEAVTWDIGAYEYVSAGGVSIRRLVNGGLVNGGLVSDGLVY